MGQASIVVVIVQWWQALLLRWLQCCYGRPPQLWVLCSGGMQILLFSCGIRPSSCGYCAVVEGLLFEVIVLWRQAFQVWLLCSAVVCRSYYLAVELGLLVVVIVHVQWWQAFLLRSLCCGLQSSQMWLLCSGQACQLLWFLYYCFGPTILCVVVAKVFVGYCAIICPWLDAFKLV